MKVLCKNKIINRAIAFLYPLELTMEDKENKEINKNIDIETKKRTHPMALRKRERKNMCELEESDIDFLISTEINKEKEITNYANCFVF